VLQRRLQRVVPRREPYEIVHRVLYSVHQRVAQTYRSGRVVLAGDAAHLNNPLGGMGMNGGIHDACNLAQKLARIWRGEADDDELDRYQRQRRAIALDYVNERSIRNKKNLETRDPDERAQFRREMEAAAAAPALSRDLLLKVSMIASLRQAAQTA
jgi:3-(3-hydroxy-phenyl)propionate hydroxylase